MQSTPSDSLSINMVRPALYDCATTVCNSKAVIIAPGAMQKEEQTFSPRKKLCRGMRDRIAPELVQFQMQSRAYLKSEAHGQLNVTRPASAQVWVLGSDVGRDSQRQKPDSAPAGINAVCRPVHDEVRQHGIGKVRVIEHVENV